jgi:hypothetical protein
MIIKCWEENRKQNERERKGNASVNGGELRDTALLIILTENHVHTNLSTDLLGPCILHVLLLIPVHLGVSCTA